MYKLQSRRLPATRYYQSYHAALADAKACGISARCIKPVH